MMFKMMMVSTFTSPSTSYYWTVHLLFLVVLTTIPSLSSSLSTSSLSLSSPSQPQDVNFNSGTAGRRDFFQLVTTATGSFVALGRPNDACADETTVTATAPVPASTTTAATAVSASATASSLYPVTYSDKEWMYMLSGAQYNILRRGGTERPFSSILESEKRAGTFVCAGCNTPLFASEAKFNSRTGWPSFASTIEDGAQTPRNTNAAMMVLAGAELKCKTCGGHLGDVFLDGKLFPGTVAFDSGKRYCIDGTALIFKPSDENSEPLYGDLPPIPKKNVNEIELPKFLQPPKIVVY